MSKFMTLLAASTALFAASPVTPAASAACLTPTCCKSGCCDKPCCTDGCSCDDCPACCGCCK